MRFDGDDRALRPVAAALDLLVPLEAAQRADARAVGAAGANLLLESDRFLAVRLLESSPQLAVLLTCCPFTT